LPSRRGSGLPSQGAASDFEPIADRASTDRAVAEQVRTSTERRRRDCRRAALPDDGVFMAPENPAAVGTEVLRKAYHRRVPGDRPQADGSGSSRPRCFRRTGLCCARPRLAPSRSSPMVPRFRAATRSCSCCTRLAGSGRSPATPSIPFFGRRSSQRSSRLIRSEATRCPGAGPAGGCGRRPPHSPPR